MDYRYRHINGKMINGERVLQRKTVYCKENGLIINMAGDREREINKEIVRVLAFTVKTIQRSWTKQNKLIRNGISKTT